MALSSIFLIFYILLTLAISAFNAWSVGSMWFETKITGGIPRLMAYAGAIMSASSFTYVYAILIGMAANAFGFLDDAHFGMMLSLVYLFLIIPIIGSGIAITINSWIIAYKQRTWTNMGIAGWNTFAQAYNMYNAISGIPASVKSVTGLFGGKTDKDNIQAKIVIGIAIVALLGGILTTTFIIRTVARSHANNFKQKLRSGATA